MGPQAGGLAACQSGNNVQIGRGLCPQGIWGRSLGGANVTHEGIARHDTHTQVESLPKTPDFLNAIEGHSHVCVHAGLGREPGELIMKTGRGERRLGLHLNQVDFLPPFCLDIWNEVADRSRLFPPAADMIRSDGEAFALKRIDQHVYHQVVKRLLKMVTLSDTRLFHFAP